MSKYFGKIFGQSTRALSFWLTYPSFLLSKLASQLKLIQSVVRVGILGICVTSSILRVLLSGFWVSGLQFPSPRDQVPGSCVPGSHVAGSQSPKSQSPGVLGLRFFTFAILTILLEATNRNSVSIDFNWQDFVEFPKPFIHAKCNILYIHLQPYVEYTIQGPTEGTSSVAFEVLIMNCKKDFINLQLSSVKYKFIHL